MQILIIAGFLGSGKTTTLKNIILRLGETDPKKMAVIINDFGEIGIDTSVVGTTGIKPVELVSGCVCCQLGPDLLKTVRDVCELYQPETIIIEPSGVANPGSVKTVLNELKDIKIERIINIILVDPLRIEFLLNIPVIGDGIGAADILVVTKTDLINVDMLKKVREQIRDLNDSAKIIEISNLNTTSLTPLVEALQIKHNAVEAQVYTKSVVVSLNDEYRYHLTSLLKKTAQKLRERGYPFWGHIKLAVKDSSGSVFYASIVDETTGPQFQGEVFGLQKPLNIEISAILYNVEKSVIQEIIDQIFSELKNK